MPINSRTGIIVNSLGADKPVLIKSRSGKLTGRQVGERPCQLAGCRGYNVGVRWPDGKLTWPCTHGMRQTKYGWRIT